jgi:hypothetical protein
LTSIQDQLYLLERKLARLRSLDKSRYVFGAAEHNYQFKNQILESEIAAFENEHEIELPEFFRHFLLHFGNGGCGPEYGLLKLEQGKYDLPQNIRESEIIRLKEPFRFTTYWNMDYSDISDFKKWQDDYDHNFWNDGMLRICHMGCGTFINLVLNGNEKGNVWIDDRSSDGGIYPFGHHSNYGSTSFYNWYLNWIELSLKKFEN